MTDLFVNDRDADRYAQEQGQLDLEQDAREATANLQIRDFMDGAPDDGNDTREVLCDVWESWALYELIETAWRSGDYTPLGPGIKALIHDSADTYYRPPSQH